MLNLPVCALSSCPFSRRIDPLAGAVGWLSYPLCCRQHFDPPCPAPQQSRIVLRKPFGELDGKPVISYAGQAVLDAQPGRLLKFLSQPIFQDDLWILCNWAAHFSQRNVSWAATRSGKSFSLYRVV